MKPNFDDPNFKNFIKNKEPQILDRTKDGIQESENFKKLQSLLTTYIEDRFNNENDVKVILIKKEDIESLLEDPKDNLYGTLDTQQAITCNHLELDSSLELINFEIKDFVTNEDARIFYNDISHQYCVFYLTSASVFPIVDGVNVGNLIFYTKRELRRFKELKDISQLTELFNEYRIYIRTRANYQNFFLSKAPKRALHRIMTDTNLTNDSQEDFLTNNQQLLNNRPEDRFRESLRLFLKERMRTDINLAKEYILEDFKRLDINIIDNYGDLYFIEVKWVGKSVGPDGDDIKTGYKETDINPEAVSQSVNYIKVLSDNGQNIKIGYLVVFDARGGELPDTVEAFDINNLDDDFRTFYPQFKKILDFKVSNDHPNH